MKKIGICGNYGGDTLSLNGQTVKTKIITEELEKRIGKEEIVTIDTFGGIKKLFSSVFKLWKLLSNCENIIILPAHNALRVFAPFLSFMNKFYKKRLHYVVIGGWLPEFIEKRNYLKKSLKNFDYIYVETNIMKKALEEQGYSNVLVMPNYKPLKILAEDELIYNTEEPYKLCTFSRVTKQKGIEDAVNAVIEVNKAKGRICYSLDIYGQIAPDYKDEFETLQNTFPDYIKYRGCVDFDKSVEVLKDYYALLFPTKHYTEGIPGTIIDAYAAGIPVISSKWESFSDVIDDSKLGIGYEFNSYSSLVDAITFSLEDKDKFDMYKINCIKKAEQYLPENVIDILYRNL